MLPEQHLSDEAVAACADGVLRGSAQQRAERHLASCAECAHAVKVQREAVWALRAAPAPPLPSQLLDRLRDVPQTTPIRTLPTALDHDGNAVLGTFAPMAAFAPPPRRHGTRGRTVAIAAAAVAITGAITAGTVAHAVGNSSSGAGDPAPSTAHTGAGSPPHGPVVVRHLGR